MQELLQELYSEEEQEESIFLFDLDLSNFQNILGQENWLKLQQEFEMQQNPLSQSLLIWADISGKQWLLADFGKEKIYYIDSPTGTREQSIVDVSELPDFDDKLKDAQTIPKLLREPQTKIEPKGTLSGFIALMMKLDFDEVHLEGLKRSDLSGSGLDFEDIHQDLVVVHGFFREILTSSSTDRTFLSDATVETVKNDLLRFYEIEAEIKGFDVSGENPTGKHADSLRKISTFCREARSVLDPIIAYVRSAQIGKYQTEFKDFFDNAASKWKEFDNESEAKLQKLDDLRIARENQIATTSISDHVIFFDNQAKKHQDSAQRWLKATVCMALVFTGTVIGLWFSMKPVGDGWTGALLQNVFTKGFVVSVFYMLLNRSIKNYTAEKHLEVVNLHRKNALATFEAFAEASGNNPHTRDQVLLASTNAIFDANQSGYLSTKTSPPDRSNLIQQIFRSVMPER